MRVLRPTRLALRRLRAQAVRNQRLQLFARAFSDAADPAKRPLGSSIAPSTSTASAPHVNGVHNGSNGHTQPETLQFLASYHEDEQHQQQDVEFTAQRIGFPISEAEYKERADYQEEDGIREESRAEATAKAERIMAVLRHSMSELEIGKVIHRIAQYATLPRVTGLSRKQFLRSLETRFGENNKREFGYMLAFLQGRDDVIDQLEIDSRMGGDAIEECTDVPIEADAVAGLNEDFVVPQIMGLHPDLVADPKFVSIVFCYCRLACLNSLKLMQRPATGFNRGSKSSLWQVKADFRKVLDMEGYSHYADMLGLEKQSLKEENEDIDAVDAEWEEFNLENDRIDFRMLLSQTQGIVDFMKTELSNETISKMLVAMLASVKTSKLHPMTALQHHQMRNEAIIRALLETRMRVGHILINDIDEVEPTQSISKKLTQEQHEKVITTAWNIVSVLDDRKYHMFFTRFLKYKLAWRPNRTTFGETFLLDVPSALQETARGRGVLEPLNDAGRERLETAWQPSHCAFYRNLPHGVTKKHLENALAHVGGVKRFFLFSNPINGPPESPYEDVDEEEDDDEEEEEQEEEEEDEGEGEDDEKPKKKKKKKAKKTKSETRCPRARNSRTSRSVVEFESESACRKATMRALQIFGVMMAGWNEYRPVFSTPADKHSGVTLMNVPYGVTVGELVDQVNGILTEAGLSMKVSGLVPRGVMLTNGRLDLRFPSFVEAAQVIELLNENVGKMKCRRALSNRDMVRVNEYLKLKKNMAKNEKKEKKKEEEEQLAQEDKKTKKYVMEVSESVEEYFAEWLEAEGNMTEEELALSEVPRPFDVTWTPLPKPRNKHMYL
ncbi:hypothetical protein GQ600_15720 [Phytophthora cactorum]|nr:hypothetical protein GQ600_15720 [Phytophthora cactorum]